MDILIFPGEYTYPEALALLKSQGLSNNDMVYHNYQGMSGGCDMKQVVSEGKLPEGKYWFPNGCGPGDDSMDCFSILPHHTPPNPGWATGVTGNLDKLKVAVMVK